MEQQNEIRISKTHPQAALISKCCRAVKTQDYSGVTRKNFEDALDAVAKAVAEEYDTTFADAYRMVMEGDEGRALYAGSQECPAVGEGTIQKHEISKAETMEREAEHFSKSYNVSMDEARQHVKAYFEQ